MKPEPIFILFVCSALAFPARALDGDRPPAAAEASASLDLFDDLTKGSRRLVDSRSAAIVGVGALATVGARSLDSGARASLAGQRSLGAVEDLGNHVLGTGIPGALLGAGFWAAGAWRGEGRWIRSGQSQLEAIAATGLATFALKAAIDRERPDRSDRRAMPSGHASTAFATATVLNEFYGWRVGIPAFALAAATGAGRIAADRHWFSDVAAGAALGVWFGRAFAIGAADDASGAGSASGARRHRGLRAAAWAPIAFDGAFGVAFVAPWPE